MYPCLVTDPCSSALRLQTVCHSLTINTGLIPFHLLYHEPLSTICSVYIYCVFLFNWLIDRSFGRPFVRVFVRPFVLLSSLFLSTAHHIVSFDPSIHSFIHSFVDWFVDWFIDWFYNKCQIIIQHFSLQTTPEWIPLTYKTNSVTLWIQFQNASMSIFQLRSLRF